MRTFAATGSTEVQSLTSEFEILRGSLVHIFYDAVKDDERFELLLGDSVEKTSRLPNRRVDLKFAEQAEPAQYDVVGAADGLGSKIRRMTFDATHPARYRPLGAFVAFFTAEANLVADSNGMAKFHQMPHGRSVLLRPNPSGCTQCTVNFVLDPDDKAAYEEIKAATKAGVNHSKQLIRTKLADAKGIVPQFLEEMARSEDFYYNEVAQVITEHLHQDGIVLLGDAGYAPTPFTRMGTSIAMIGKGTPNVLKAVAYLMAGAYILAGEIMPHPDDMEAAAQQYQDTMLPFIKTVQKLPPGIPQVVNPQTQMGLNISNFILSVASWARLDKLVAMLNVFPSLSRSKSDLPGYYWPSETQ